MKKTTFLQIDGFISKNKYKKNWRRVASILSCFVIILTVYMLILPAKTLENDLDVSPDTTNPQIDYSVQNLTADNEAVIENPPEYINTVSKTTVSVSASWTNPPFSGNMIVTLYKDGYSTGKTLILNSENEWKGEFSELEAGSYTIEYTTIDGYAYSVNSKSIENYEFLQTNSLVNGNTYILVSGITAKRAVQNSSGTTLTDANIRVDGTKISEAPDDVQWYYNGYSLKNVATSNYLKLNSSGASTDSSVQNQIVYENGHLKRSDTATRYLIWYNNAYTSTSLSTYATNFTLYEKLNTFTSVDFQITAEAKKGNTDNSDISSFEHNKTIDYLGDEVLNPDTNISGQDYYRLYLDMTGKQEPVDLLIVVDGSGSMSKTDVDNMRRDAAITKFLNGSTNASNKDGFISYFLNLNSQNKVSVIQFYGKSADRNTHNISNSALDYTYDSTVLLGWTGKNSFVNCANQNNNGTNYEAGLKRAANQFAKVSDDGQKKIMLFLSDGVPTYFQIDANDVGTVCNGYTIKASDVGKRWGTGSYTSTSNYPYCKNPSKRAFDDFLTSSPGVTVFTIGVSADISETSQSESQSPEVLKYMAEHGGGAFLSVMSSMDEMKLKLQSIFYPKDVTITDNLSKYVRYYSEKPDALVTMTEKSTGAVTVLYSNGKPTSAATGILTDVTYTAVDTADAPAGSTGVVSAIFDVNYQLMPEYVYTLSFNVKTTQTAYNEYSSDGYNAVGDAGTDYRENKTSSFKDGFYSNDSAFVSYHVSDSMIKEVYRKPVIQVEMPKGISSCTLIVAKVVSGAKTAGTFPFELSVTDSEGTAIDLSGKNIPDGVTLKDTDSIYNVLEFSLSDGESITFEKLIPKGAKLTLTETEHTGYTVSMNVGDLGNFGGESQSFDINDELKVTVTNSAGVRLPETGSAGELLLTLGGLLIIAGACVYGFVQKCIRERRFE